jgi:hypothetical protein
MKLDLFKTNGSSPPTTDVYAGRIAILLIEHATEVSTSSLLSTRQNRDFSTQAQSPARVQNFTAVVDRPRTMNTGCPWSSLSRSHVPRVIDANGWRPTPESRG